VEKAIGVTPIETVSIHPLKPLYQACLKMVQSRARRIPIVDYDDETQRAMVVSVITQYRILKFVAINVGETQLLRKPLRDLNMGSYGDLKTASMDTPVMDVIHMLVQKNISSVPILDSEGLSVLLGTVFLLNHVKLYPGIVINVFEAVDVIALIKGGVYDDLAMNVGEALLKRSEVRLTISPGQLVAKLTSSRTSPASTPAP